MSPTLLATPVAVVEMTSAVLATLVLASAAAAAAAHAVRRRQQTRRRRAEALARPLILAALDAPSSAAAHGPRQHQPPLPAAVALCLEPMVISLASKLRGTDRQVLVAWMTRRGLVDSARFRTRSVWAIRRLRAVEVLGALGLPHLLPDLRLRLDDRNADVRRAAVRAVGRTAAPGAVPALLAVLDRARRPVPEHCVTLALLRLGPAAAGDLAIALTGGRPVERAAAAAVLGWLGDLGCVEALCSALDEGHPIVVLPAITALGRIGSSAAAARLRSRLSPDQPAGVRVAAAGALGRLGDRDSSDLLAGLLTEDHDLARAAASALMQLGIAGRDALQRACETVPEARELVARA